MDYFVNGLIWAGIGLVIAFLWAFIKNFIKARKDPDVILASKLGMSMPIFKDCQKLFEERQEWFKSNEYEKSGYKKVRMPKNPNAYRKYEQYMFYKEEVEKWNGSDDLTKEIMSFNNPYTKDEYKWIRDLKL